MSFLRKLTAHWKPNAGGRYLAYGRRLRPLTFLEPQPMPLASYIEPEHKSYKSGLIAVAALQSGVFGLPDGRYGLFIVNVGDQALSFRFELTPGRYPLSPTQPYRVARLSQTGEPHGQPTIHMGRIACSADVGPHDVAFLEAQPAPGKE
jgi:hypothetical protein